MARPVKVSEIARAIESAFPSSSAAFWDCNGLVVGDGNREVTGVVFALDPTLEVINHAHQMGANVVVTHHPVYITPPERLAVDSSYASNVIHAAIRNNIALINAHTNLDLAIRSKNLIGEKLMLRSEGELPSSGDDVGGQGAPFGQLWSGDVRSLAEVARQCVAVFGQPARVWGKPDHQVTRVATATGSASSRIEEAVAAHVDLLIGGEVKYHDAMSAIERGVAVIELGHDVSEWLMVPLLQEVVVENCGLPTTMIHQFDSNPRWWIETGDKV